MAEGEGQLIARKLTHEQAREEQRLHWSRMTGPERLRAMTELTRQMLRMRGIDVDEPPADLTARWVRRSWR